ncbi:MAG: M14 family metallocarboxypeptidase [Verrucomicrobiae bacterium]|nr:M14 family metallocarboxypeptidase [Verrucomicrobiae bacterium]
MAMPVVRDYRRLEQRLQRLSRRVWHVEPVGLVDGLRFYQVRPRKPRAGPTILLSAGIHGEEPAGVEAVLTFLESSPAGARVVNWIIWPCINPYGWERNQRRSRQGLDINRQFRGRTRCEHARLIKRLVAGRHFVLSLEFHEDVDGQGYYLYEGCRDRTPLAPAILARVARVMPLDPRPQIDGHRADGRGLILRPLTRAAMRRRRQWPMAYHLFAHHTDHVLGSETPVGAPLDRRVAAHLAALEVVIAAVSGDRGQ